MIAQNTAEAGKSLHRAEDDLFHFDRSTAGRTTECDIGLFRSKLSARSWVTGLRPRWLVEASQPLVRPRCEK